MKNKKYLSLNEKGEIECLTKEEYKALRLGCTFVVCDFGIKEVYEKIYYWPYNFYVKSFGWIIDTCAEFEFLSDFMGSWYPLTSKFEHAKLYNSFQVFLHKAFGFFHKALKVVECSRYLKATVDEELRKEEELPI